MSEQRKQIINILSAFADRKQMKQQYGITPTDEQIEKAKEIIRYYQQAPEEEINFIHSRKTLKWPYALNEKQKYDRLMHKAELSVPQRLLWMQIKPCLSDHPKEQKTDVCWLEKPQQN